MVLAGWRSTCCVPPDLDLGTTGRVGARSALPVRTDCEPGGELHHAHGTRRRNGRWSAGDPVEPAGLAGGRQPTIAEATHRLVNAVLNNPPSTRRHDPVLEYVFRVVTDPAISGQLARVVGGAVGRVGRCVCRVGSAPLARSQLLGRNIAGCWSGRVSGGPPPVRSFR